VVCRRRVATVEGDSFVADATTLELILSIPGVETPGKVQIDVTRRNPVSHAVVMIQRTQPPDSTAAMGIEVLTERTMYVERADGPELLEIKRGAWPVEKVKAEAERLFQLAQEA
jgi:hypothetical protein